MDHENKIDKSKNYSQLSDYPKSFRAVLNVIPDNVIEEISSKNLGILIDAIWKSWKETKRIHEADIVADGMIWDEINQRMLEICQS